MPLLRVVGIFLAVASSALAVTFALRAETDAGETLGLILVIVVPTPLPAVLLAWLIPRSKWALAGLVLWTAINTLIWPFIWYSDARWGDTTDCPGCDDWIGALALTPLMMMAIAPLTAFMIWVGYGDPPPEGTDN